MDKCPAKLHVEQFMSTVFHFPMHKVAIFFEYDRTQGPPILGEDEVPIGVHVTGDLDLTVMKQMLEQYLHPNCQPQQPTAYQRLSLQRARRVLEHLSTIAKGIDDEAADLTVPIIQYVDSKGQGDDFSVMAPYKLDDWVSHYLEWYEGELELSHPHVATTIRQAIVILNRAFPAIHAEIMKSLQAFYASHPQPAAVVA